jgi:hypothetical protein
VIVDSMQAFARAVQARLSNDPHFEPLSVPRLDRRPLVFDEGWDCVQSIFPFLIFHPETPHGRIPLNRLEMQQIYRQLPIVIGSDNAVSKSRCQLGQPVECGVRNGVAVSALRICISARLISDALAGPGIAGVIDKAMIAMDKVALLADRLNDSAVDSGCDGHDSLIAGHAADDAAGNGANLDAFACAGVVQRNP